MDRVDVLIIGSGIAGLTAARLLSGQGSVLVVTKGRLREANTYWAQGGIAAAITGEDSFESHSKDTLIAGANHNDKKAVRFLVEHGPRAIQFLQSIGVRFQKQPGLEGGHSRARVWRTDDFTGRGILTRLIQAVKADKKIKILEDTDAVRLITRRKRCAGAWVRQGDSPTCQPLLAGATILATGGLGQLFGRTTNTLGSGGDGIALALRAGLKMKDLEFVQFHPTAFAHPDHGRYFLLSEALRGFGAHIVNAEGERFLATVHPQAELAPRDIVARTIYLRQQKELVYLDMRHLSARAVQKHFPNIAERLKSYGFDLTADLVPITPVAHYACGGIPTDLTGATALPGLYALGEVARTGVHGANRLASNSLLEAVVFAQGLAENIDFVPLPSSIPPIPSAGAQNFVPLLDPLEKVKSQARQMGQIMWRGAGIIRTRQGLLSAQKQIRDIPARDDRVKNRQLVCQAILQSCLAREKSLGTHYVV